MTKKKSLLVMLPVALLVAVGAWGYIRTLKGPGWQTVPIERGGITSTITATGTCNAVVTVQVGSQVSGNIKALYADFNTRVKKGQLVALIDPQIFEARVQQARAGVDSANAAVVNAEALVSKSQADVAVARAAAENQRANVAKAKVAALDAKTKLDRRVVMFKDGILGKEDFDTAQAQYDSMVADQDSAQAQYNAAVQNIAAAEAEAKVAPTQLASARALVKQNQASLTQAELDLAHTKILAPVDGTVVARRMDVGQTVAASFQAPTIFEIAQDLTKMQVDTNVDEADVGRVMVDQKAAFTVDAYQGRTFPSRVSEIRRAPIVAQNVVTYDVVAAADNSDLKLYPGMTASVRILVDHVDQTLKVPNAALRFHPTETAVVHAAGKPARGKNSTIYVLDANGALKEIPVQLGISDGAYTAVSSPELKEGMRAVVAAGARNGSTGGEAPRPPRGPSF